MRQGGADAADIGLAALALLWAGIAIGVAWIATPVKFSAPSLTLPVALEVGRVTFHLFSRIEWGLAAVLALLVWRARPPRATTIIAALLTVLVIANALALLPALDARTALVIAGDTPPPSHLHHLYIAAEAIKLCLLLAIAAGALCRMKGERR